MIRYRKYRVLVAVAFVIVVALWHFNHVRKWQPMRALGPRPIKENQPFTEVKQAEGSPDQQKADDESLGIARESNIPTAHVSAADGDGERIKESLPPVPEESKPVQVISPDDAEGKSEVDEDEYDDQEQNDENTAVISEATDALPAGQVDELAEIPLPLNKPPPSKSVVHWSSMQENYPVTSTIQLPEGSPKPIPRIQHEFAPESEEERALRENRLEAIKGEFLHAWAGYRDNAWLNDELTPLSGKSKNPFCGWAATLVDSLDTLWIMGLTEEFENAVKAVEEIDFTTSIRNDIPLFETVIRYLGGLVAAFDVSGGKYTILLDKAVELADILMGAFDTLNRMPLTFYQWKPAAASKKHLAGHSVVLAELGSLSVEFTRLAQITLEPKYYDAVARITDALEEWQDKTRLPGMWPIYVDASGCKTPGFQSVSSDKASAYNTRVFNIMKNLVADEEDNKNKAHIVELESLINPDYTEVSPEETVEGEGIEGNAITDTLNKRQVERLGQLDMTPADKDDPFGKSSCVPHGLDSTSSYGTETFTLAGQSDSTYEYLPKQYILLGGLVEKYRTMYEKSAEVFIEKLFFRPMTEENLDILISGDLHVYNHAPGEKQPYTEQIPQNSHLTCFVGGMMSMAAKIFGRDGDLELASKITKGCIWGYDSTTTGIMPEEFVVIPCADLSNCQWNETRWQDILDPYSESRQAQYERQLKAAKDRADREVRIRANRIEQAKLRNEELENAQTEQSNQEHFTETLEQSDEFHGSDENNNKKIKRDVETKESTYLSPRFDGTGRSGLNHDKTDQSSQLDYPYHIRPPSTHEEFAKARIHEERLPKGFSKITRRNYLLRPEAIESVYYMYRITGDPYWREAGWRMFNNICAATRATHGHSAIDDVTKTVPRQTDSMESFWLAETLKYFFLLFSREDVISLDEWVFNTEAHPMRRPDA